MAEVVVTRGGQITLTKDVRSRLRVEEGDIIIVNVIGNMIMASKRDPSVFDKRDFLPENFEKVIRNIRSSPEGRLKRFGIIHA
ncbi:MAG: AbrB/MazE/SpoVT family DNA-binding domain-containing protein [Candidatus Aenigmarchaeota archaeon]|nr:AbrB/MazE/SpoVT family DNA-binding domain-containing protein [Candidatus Aenigmarchaeota archaeon]